LVKYEIARMESYTHRIKTFFDEADVDKSGTLSWEEFEAHLRNNKVKAYFQALELDVSQAHILFQLLDTDNSNSVGLDEFLDGCLRLKGQARGIDMNLLIFMCEKVFSHIGTTETDIQAIRKMLQQQTELKIEPDSLDTHGPQGGTEV